MNSRERILAILGRKPVDRIAIDLWHTPEVERKLQEHFAVDNSLDLYKVMGLDKIVWVFVDYKAPSGEIEGTQAGAGAEGTRTMWGVPLKMIRAGRENYHEFVEPPMASFDHPDKIAIYPFWPDPARFDYDSAVRRAEQASRDFAVIGPWVSLFEIYCQLRGLEQAMMDVALNPTLVEAILDRVEQILTEMMKKFLDQASCYLDMVFVSDDVGSQRGLLFSPNVWRQHLMPRMARWCDLIHSYGLTVFYHTDGAVEPLVQPLIDCGIDVLNPVQHICAGMDPAELKRRYGNQVIFHGGVDNQNVLPFGNPDDVRREVQYLMNTLGGNREGYICCSCHNIQANTPLENILTMVQTVKQYGKVPRRRIREICAKRRASREIHSESRAKGTA
ncbi:MAG TPA: uroporphyrinogen decarboxylase family protein [Sedimentisphaerales bacterium]|nr:uroporphyrinogen decarboxylase family protein [Sedimentisphaerales bacterium]